MKNFLNRSLGLLVVSVIMLLSSCQDEAMTTETYRAMVPVYLQMSDIRARQMVVEPGKELENPGKIYLYGDLLLINEPLKGIHILDNSNPAAPVNLNFIPIEGNVDLAVNDNMLYADNYVDLLVFDISNIRAIKQVERVENVFNHLYSNSETGVIITFKDTVITSTSIRDFRAENIFLTSSSLGFSSNFSDASRSYGQGGSMARFTLMSGHLYAVDDYSLRVFDVEEPASPQHLKNIELGWGIETIFPFQGNLFIGSTTGMHIYEASTPSDPTRLAVFEHAQACDPVVVNEDYAFVTLRSGNTCWNGVNQLQVVDIENLRQPKLVKAYDMLNPHGLALAGDYLYLAEGQHGLKSFKVSDVNQIDQNQLEFLTQMKSVDIIPGPKSLIVIGPDGVCQFDYSTPSRLKPLSCINVKNPVVV
ncbi:LVIVD repeat-containing protein [Algoriphagus namhaensis]